MAQVRRQSGAAADTACRHANRDRECRLNTIGLQADCVVVELSTNAAPKTKRPPFEVAVLFCFDGLPDYFVTILAGADTMLAFTSRSFPYPPISGFYCYRSYSKFATNLIIAHCGLDASFVCRRPRPNPAAKAFATSINSTTSTNSKGDYGAA
jgi:hypothetical protein